MEKILEWELPIKTESEMNMSEHWGTRASRANTQKRMINLAFHSHSPIELPCTVRLIRISQRELDGDNLQGAFKYVRDAIADNLIPGLKPGRADGDPRITWEYDQEKGKPIHVKIIFYK
jgi:hypothetical protein